MSSYEELISKLDAFIRKYYTNQLIRGGLYSTALITIFFLVIVALEGAGRFGTTLRTILFFSFLIFLLAVFYRFILTPILKLFAFGKRISNEQAAEIIGKHFPNVSDKLINTLELRQMSTESSLVLASIEKRSHELKPVPFSSAIDYYENRRYLKYALPPLAVFIVLLFAAPTLITGPTERILEYDEHFEIPRPFEFVVQNESLSGIKNEDFVLELKIEGQELPAEVFIEVDGLRYQMDKKSNNDFKYTARNLQTTVKFNFYASGFSSVDYELVVHPRPLVKQSQLIVEYPSYLKKEAESIVGISDVYLNEGAKVVWKIETEHTDKVFVLSSDTQFLAQRLSRDVYSSEFEVVESGQRLAVPTTEVLGTIDTLSLNMQVIKDEFPSIEFVQLDDSAAVGRMTFRGNIRDDHGFTQLNFVYKVNNNSEVKTPISFNSNLSDLNFFHLFMLSELNLKPEDELVYYFEVYDNDGYNGPKYKRSELRVHKIPSKREIQEKTEEQSEKTKEDLEASLKEAQLLRKELEKFNRKMIEKKNLNWEDKKQLKELNRRQNELTQKLENIKRENERNNQRKNEFDPPSEELMQKQQQLQELLEKVLDEDMKKMLEDIEKMMDEMNKEKLQRQVDEMKLDNKELEKELDRSLELFKQLEFEQKMEDVLKNMEDLAEKEEKLSDETLDKKNDQNELNKKQEEIQKEFEDLKKDLKDLEQKNNELEQKNELPNLENEKQAAEKNMEQSKQESSSGQQKKSSQSRQNASQQMKQMQKKMQSAKEKMEEQQQAEDLEKLRRLRQNLLELSFSQEELIEEVKVTQGNDPHFVELTREQKKIRDDSRMIEDSLFALSKRNIQIKSVVNREIGLINDNLDKSIKSMANRKIPESLNRQQYVMTSFNNLALMLDESIQSAQKQQSQKKFGKKSCSKPGGGSPSMGEMKKSQKKLSEQLKQLQKQMQESGKKPGAQGKKGGRGNKLSEQAAKMAAEQAAIRNQLRKMMEGMGQDGKNGKGTEQLKRIEELMEQNEEDLVNMRLSRESIRRQEEIMSRLLESERAEREQEYDNKRESETAEDRYLQDQILLEYQKQKEQQIELLESIPLNLKPFYRNKVNEYYNKL